MQVCEGIYEGEEIIDMDEKAETKAIEKWLRTVDKPLTRKEEEKKDRKPKYKKSKK